MRRLPRRAVLVAVLWVAVAAGCHPLALEQSISMEAVYPSPDQSQVTIRYTVPPPPAGKVYVLWIVNPAEHAAVNVGEVPGGRDRVAHATVSFEATGAVISIESRPDPPRMSDTWALKVGSVLPATPTPSGSLPAASTAPSAVPTPGVVSP